MHSNTWLFPPQLCSVRTCGPIWSPPTRRSTRAPPWEPSPPRPSLSAWTTKQTRGRFPSLTRTCCMFVRFVISEQWSAAPVASRRRRGGMSICIAQHTHAAAHAHIIVTLHHMVISVMCVMEQVTQRAWQHAANTQSHAHTYTLHMDRLVRNEDVRVDLQGGRNALKIQHKSFHNRE